jgi:hypothetical protein
MTDTTVTESVVGTTLASGGTVTSITLTAPPKLNASGWFMLVDHDANGNYIDDIFVMNTGSMPFPTGTVFPLYGHPFTNLVCTSISSDSTFIVTTNP